MCRARKSKATTAGELIRKTVLDRGVLARGQGGHGFSNFLEIGRFLETLMCHWTIIELLLLVKIKVSNFIGKSLNLSPLLCRDHGASGNRLIKFLVT